MRLEIDTLAGFDEAAAAGDLKRAVIQSLDLRHRDDVLAITAVAGAVFLGCRLEEEMALDLKRRGALLFPTLPDVPLNPYQPQLYRPINLFDHLPDGDYADSFDARVYAWTRGAEHPPSLDHALAASLHDHAISDALNDYVAGVDPRSIVGIMGGHALARGTDGYADTARLGRSLARGGMLVASGGGPGAMEAANLGARLSVHEDRDLDEALDMLATVPSFTPSIDAWVRIGFEVRERFSGGADSLGIPTWFYGHEPPNVFASRIAKYCSNAIREDVLLHRCQGGLVYLAGAAGTVQELFQAVTGNYYAPDPTSITPLVLVGVEQWTKRLPAWPLLQEMAKGRHMESWIFLVDDVTEAGELLLSLRA